MRKTKRQTCVSTKNNKVYNSTYDVKYSFSRTHENKKVFEEQNWRLKKKGKYLIYKFVKTNTQPNSLINLALVLFNSLPGVYYVSTLFIYNNKMFFWYQIQFLS